MGHHGYKWSLTADGAKWRWKALDRECGAVIMQGVADSRAEAAAWLARTMALGVIAASRESVTA